MQYTLGVGVFAHPSSPHITMHTHTHTAAHTPTPHPYPTPLPTHIPTTHRLFADAMNNIGLALELASPAFPSLFMLLSCLGSIAHAITGVAGAATRAAMTHHFAQRNNAADIAAKECSQETAAVLVGMLLGLGVAHAAEGSAGVAGVVGECGVLLVVWWAEVGKSHGGVCMCVYAFVQEQVEHAYSSVVQIMQACVGSTHAVQVFSCVQYSMEYGCLCLHTHVHTQGALLLHGQHSCC